MAERLRLINPDAVIETRVEFYNEKSSPRLLSPEPDMVVDAIDNVTAKMHLIVTCLRQNVRIVSTMGAAAKLDPTMVRVADLSATKMCPLARHLRKYLRRNHDLDASKFVGLPVVYSEEAPAEPQWLAYDDGVFRCVCPSGTNGLNDCDHKHRIDGSVAYVTSVFGMVAASVVVKAITAEVAVRAVAETRASAPCAHVAGHGDDAEAACLH